MLSFLPLGLISIEESFIHNKIARVYKKVRLPLSKVRKYFYDG